MGIQDGQGAGKSFGGRSNRRPSRSSVHSTGGAVRARSTTQRQCSEFALWPSGFPCGGGISVSKICSGGSTVIRRADRTGAPPTEGLFGEERKGGIIRSKPAAARAHRHS